MSKTIDGASIRKQRFNQILDYIKKKENLSEKQLKTKIAIETGLTPRRIEIYFEELKTAGLIQAENDEITLPVQQAGEPTND